MKRLLIVVDYQNDFVNGSLGFEKAQLLEEHIIQLIKEYHMNGDEIIYTMDTHQQNYLETYEGHQLNTALKIQKVGNSMEKLENYFKIAYASKNLLFLL